MTKNIRLNELLTTEVLDQILEQRDYQTNGLPQACWLYLWNEHKEHALHFSLDTITEHIQLSL